MPGRTWIIAPDRETLERRWERLVNEKDEVKREKLFHPHEGGDKTSTKASQVGLAGHEFRSHSIASDKAKAIAPPRYAFRSFDRQWIIPDNRLINRPNPTLWKAWSDKQVFVTGLDAHSPKSGPALSLCGAIPDLHHYKGSFGGRVYPLWADARGKQPNVRAEVLQALAKTHGAPVGAEDLIAYIAALMAHPAFTARFRVDLVRPGLRVPLTADKKLFDEAVKLGHEVAWLHCYGERFVDTTAGRPRAEERGAVHSRRRRHSARARAVAGDHGS
jgi:predicted helicase